MYGNWQESRIRLLIALQSGIQTVESRIQTSEESRIHIMGQFSGIQNPRSARITLHGTIQGTESFHPVRRLIVVKILLKCK
jgi:hypothetical protein